MPRLILLRHGQSVWNLANRFTGWEDVDLTPRGLEEAKRAGETLKAEGIECDLAFTSYLTRAIRTLWITLDALDSLWVPVIRAWELNERHYGALTGLDKKDSVKKHGPEQVHLWRRSFDTPPPALSADDPRHPRHDRRYAGIANLPATECLKDCLERVVPYWDQHIVPELSAGKCVIVVAHGNSLRALVMHLDQLTPEQIASVNIPTGFPLLYELDEKMRPTSSRYLGDQAAIKAAIEGVANQTAVKNKD